MLVSKQQFARLLTHVTKAVESRNTIPILGHVKLVNEANRLTATATDLDIEITGSIEAEGDDCAFTVDARMLADIVKKLSGDSVTIEPADNRVTVKAGRSRFTLDTLPIADFPTFGDSKFTTEFDIDLAALVAPVRFAVSTEEARFYLCGVYLETGRATATDGHRMVTRTTEPWAEHAGVILPAKLVGMLPAGVVHVSLSDTKVRLATGDAATGDGVVITSKLIDGTYPDYQRVIPQNNTQIVTVDNATLRAAAERVAVISSERGRSVKLAVAGDNIDLSARGNGEAQDSVGCTYTGEPFECGFNATYLVDVLSNLPAGDVRIAFEGGGSPVLFTTEADTGLQLVLMPMRVGG